MGQPQSDKRTRQAFYRHSTALDLCKMFETVVRVPREKYTPEILNEWKSRADADTVMVDMALAAAKADKFALLDTLLQKPGEGSWAQVLAVAAEHGCDRGRLDALASQMTEDEIEQAGALCMSETHGAALGEILMWRRHGALEAAVHESVDMNSKPMTPGRKL